MEWESFKEQGNTEYKAGNWLKAAALYSKGLKADPTNAVLLSNRSAAFLRLSKIQRALADAEDCIRLKPDWDKGYFRKGLVLESVNKHEEALVAFQEAARLAPDSKEIAKKVKALGRLVKNPKPQADAAQQSTSKQIGSGGVHVHAEGSNGQAAETPSSAERIKQFGKDMIQLVQNEIQGKTFDRTFPLVYFLPGKAGKDATEKRVDVSMKAAFDSPETLSQAIAFLREYAEDTSSQAAVLVVPKHKIAYPQVWQKPSWPMGKSDGIFVQLEALGTRNLWFIPLGQKSREPVALKDKFVLMEPLFK